MSSGRITAGQNLHNGYAATAAVMSRDSFRQIAIPLPPSNNTAAITVSGPVDASNWLPQPEDDGFVGFVRVRGGGEHSCSTPQSLTISSRLTRRLQSLSPCARRIALALSHGARAPAATNTNPTSTSTSAHPSSSGFGRSGSSSPTEHAALEEVRAQIARAFLPTDQPQHLCTATEQDTQLQLVTYDVPVERASQNRGYLYVPNSTGGEVTQTVQREHTARVLARTRTPSLPSASSVSVSPTRRTYSFTSSSSSSPSASASASATASRASSKGRDCEQSLICGAAGGVGLLPPLSQSQSQAHRRQSECVGVAGGCTPHSMRSFRSSLKNLLLEPARKHLIAIGGPCVAANALVNENEREPYERKTESETHKSIERSSMEQPETDRHQEVCSGETSSTCWRPREFQREYQQLMRPVAIHSHNHSHSSTSCCPFPVSVFPTPHSIGPSSTSASAAAAHLLRAENQEYCSMGASWNCFEPRQAAADLFDEQLTSAEYLLPDDGDGDFDGASGESLFGSYRESALIGPSGAGVRAAQAPNPNPWAPLPIPPNTSSSGQAPTSSRRSRRSSPSDDEKEPYYCRPLSLIAAEDAASPVCHGAQQTQSGQLSDGDRCTSCSATSWSFTPCPPRRMSSSRPPLPPVPNQFVSRDQLASQQVASQQVAYRYDYTPFYQEHQNEYEKEIDKENLPWRLASDVRGDHVSLAPMLVRTEVRGGVREAQQEVPQAQRALALLRPYCRADANRDDARAQVPVSYPIPAGFAAGVAVAVQAESGFAFQALQSDHAIYCSRAEAPISAPISASAVESFGFRLTPYAPNPNAALPATPVYHLPAPAAQPQHYQQQHLQQSPLANNQQLLLEVERRARECECSEACWPQLSSDAMRMLCEALTQHYDRELRAAHAAAVRLAEPLHQRLALLLAHNLHCIRGKHVSGVRKLQTRFHRQLNELADRCRASRTKLDKELNQILQREAAEAAAEAKSGAPRRRGKLGHFLHRLFSRARAHAESKRCEEVAAVTVGTGAETRAAVRELLERRHAGERVFIEQLYRAHSAYLIALNEAVNIICESLERLHGGCAGGGSGSAGGNGTSGKTKKYKKTAQEAGAQTAAGGGGVREQVYAKVGALQLHAIRALDAGAGALVRELAAPVAAVDGRAEGVASEH